MIVRFPLKKVYDNPNPSQLSNYTLQFFLHSFVITNYTDLSCATSWQTPPISFLYTFPSRSSIFWLLDSHTLTSLHKMWKVICLLHFDENPDKNLHKKLNFSGIMFSAVWHIANLQWRIIKILNLGTGSCFCSHWWWTKWIQSWRENLKNPFHATMK